MSDIISDLIRVHEMLTSNPFPQAIWFIDRDREYVRFGRAFPEAAPDPYTARMGTMFGLSVHRWRSSEIREQIFELLDRRFWSLERARRIFPLCQSGIWVQMSNGKHQRLVLLS